MGLIEKLTGRNSNDEDFFTDEKAVENVSLKLDDIGTNTVNTARDNVVSAIDALNSLPGVADYIGTLDTNNVATGFETISSCVLGLKTTMDGIKDDVLAYSNASFGTKLLSSFSMVGFKFFEGAFGIIEDVGDAVLSPIGFVSGILGFKGAQASISNIIKDEWSHDMFNFYYNSDFAKASAIKEKSWIAGAAKFAGATGALVLTGVGVAAVSGGASAEISAKALGMIQAAVIGQGVGTEAALNSGKSMNTAFLCGVGTAAVSAGAAWVIGTIAEKISSGAMSSKNTSKSGFDIPEDGTQFRGTDLREGTTFTTSSGNTYDLSGKIGDESSGAYKHIAEEAKYATKGDQFYNPNELDSMLRKASELSGDPRYAEVADRIASQGSSISITGKGATRKTIKSALSIMRDNLTPEEYEIMNFNFTNRTVDTVRIQKLASQSGIDFTRTDLLTSTSLTREEAGIVEQYAIDASRKIYGNAIENFDRGIIVSGGTTTTTTSDLMGVPVICNGAQDGSTPYYIEILTKPSTISGNKSTVYHLCSKGPDSAGISVTDAVANQARRAMETSLTRTGSGIIESTSDASSEQVMNSLSETITQRLSSPTGDLYISDPILQKEATDYVSRKLSGETGKRITQLYMDKAASEAAGSGASEIKQITSKIVELLK